MEGAYGAAECGDSGMKWLTAQGIGALLSMSPRNVRERLALRPDFPRPLRIAGVYATPG